MRCFRRWCLLLLTLAAFARPAVAGTWHEWDAFYRDFAAWPLDSTQVATVNSLLLERDACTIALEDGLLALAAPLGGKVVAATFVGRGTLQFTPRSEIEREQLRRYFGTPAVRRSFQQLTLVFADTTLAELRSALAFRADTLGGLRRAWRATFAYLTLPRLHAVRPLPLAQSLLDGGDDGLFWALASDPRSEEPLFFTLDPTSTERVQLGVRPEDDRQGLVRYYNAETVSQFTAAGDPDTLRRDLAPPYEAVHYAIRATLAPDLSLRAAADVDVVAHGRAREWFGFQLPKALTLAGVTADGRTLSARQEAGNDLLWVHCEPPFAAGERATFHFRYGGPCFERRENWVVHRFTDSWYPQPWCGGDATWDLSFEYPRDVQLVAAGECVARADSGAVRRSTWRVATPVPWASFDANFLRATVVEDDSLPPVTVWMRHLERAGEVRRTTSAALAGTHEADDRVARDVARCLRFFRAEFGPAPAPTFDAVETSLLRYEAYPGLIHMMPVEDKLLPGAAWTPDAIRAHEIAHQWFGIGVRPATYHDMWLAEGFANFLSIWYLQAERHDAHSYFAVLAGWRQSLLDNRRYPLGPGQQAGPIWLGPRTSTSRTRHDYDLVVYEKGAWVLHMLRNYLLRDDDPGETRFRGLLREFYARFTGRRAFTEDFRAAVERATGEDMGWFFAQWVYGTAVPVYRFTWRVEPTADGRWRVHGRVEQSRVPDAFRMPVLVRVDFGHDRFARQRVWVSGPVTEFDLPPATEQPTGVVFNDLEGVLCEIVR